ncbi:MAG: iron chelate uptake ABC transporter family permease subunit [Pseudomonadota bacterium]
MLDDFFARAMLAGLAIAAVAGPFGCFIIWRRMAYFGDTLGHAGLFGVALGLLFQVNIMLGVFFVSAMVALALVTLSGRTLVPTDSLLGIFSHAALAAGLIALSLMENIRIDVMALLVGDILSVTITDLLVIGGGGALLLAALFFLRKPLLAITVNRDLARAEGVQVKAIELAFMLLCALLVALAMKLVGVLLITALLIIPAAAAGRLSAGPEQMAALATGLGMAAVASGLLASLQWDTPSGPSIVVAAFALFVVTGIIAMARNYWRTSS